MTTTLSQDERVIARIMFRNLVQSANGSAFQQLFWDVMRAKHGQAFVQIRPQGAKGDGGNDGFLPADGHYFQVYGPVDPIDKVTTAAAKLADDFSKLTHGWTPRHSAHIHSSSMTNTKARSLTLQKHWKQLRPAIPV